MKDIAPTFPAPRVFLQTERDDNWWIGPATVAVTLLAFIVYATWAALQGDHYAWGPYISPFYSPTLDIGGGLSPAIFIVWAPAGFRATCYYFRKAYYRAFFMSPPGCAVSANPRDFRGERGLLVLQNLHRYFLYLALVLLVFHVHDSYLSFFFEDGFHVNVGSLVLTLDMLLLVGFVFGCNSLRHLVGGNVDCYSCVPLGRQRHQLWRLVSFFNRRHREFAWTSLVWVGVADLYIRLVSMGIITDIRII